VNDDRAAEIRLVTSLHFAAMDMARAHLAATSIPDPAYKKLRPLLGRR
jgi:hypothetical protein